MSAEEMAERIERGLATLSPHYVEGDGGSANDPAAWMMAAAAIADLLHALDSLDAEDMEHVEPERVFSLALLHYTEERAKVEPRCDVCNVLDVEAADWCGECGCCRAHCQQHEGCEVRA